MTDQPAIPELSQRLRDLWAKSDNLPDAVRDGLQACLAVAPSDASPEQVLADTFARLGYLPGEAQQAAAKILVDDPRHVTPD